MLLTVYDIETSGFIQKDKPMPDVYQLGFIRVNTNFEVRGCGSLYFYNPATYGEPSPGALEANGLTLDFLETKKEEFDKNLATAYALLHNSLVVGKNNIRFDNLVISGFLNKYRPEKVGSFCLGKSIDVQSYMAILYRDYCAKNGIPCTSRKQGTLEDYLKVMEADENVVRQFAKNNNIQLGEGRLHDALYDATITYMCLCYLMVIKKMQVTPV